VLPQGYLLPSVPRAPHSHSISVGRRPPAHRQKSAAEDQSIQFNGRSALPRAPQVIPVSPKSHWSGSTHAPAATQRWNCATAVFVRAIANCLTRTRRLGSSSSGPPFDPVRNVPPGITTQSIRAGLAHLIATPCVMAACRARFLPFAVGRRGVLLAPRDDRSMREPPPPSLPTAEGASRRARTSAGIATIRANMAAMRIP
jgi:hypothetical protein